MSLWICTSCSGEGFSGCGVMMSIRSDTTPEEFQETIRKFPRYSFGHGGLSGWNALGTAAYEGNVQLVEYILRTDEQPRYLIHLGNGVGETPLFLAAMCRNLERGFLCAQRLIEREPIHIDVNIATRAHGVGPAEATPLYAAIEITHNVALATLLRRKGAIANPALSEEGRAMLDQIDRKLAAEKEKKAESKQESAIDS